MTYQEMSRILIYGSYRDLFCIGVYLSYRVILIHNYTDGCDGGGNKIEIFFGLS